jgi:TonB family protein
MNRLASKSALATLATLAIAFGAAAQDRSDPQLMSEYVGKVLTLRHFYAGNRLRFHFDGSLSLNDVPVGPWTVDGQILIERIQVESSVLYLQGRRIVLCAGEERMQDCLTLIPTNNKDAVKFLRDRHVRIDVELPSERPDQKQIADAMNAVFLTPESSLLDFAPDYWRTYLSRVEGTPEKLRTPEVASHLVPGKKSPPRGISMPSPGYSDDARRIRCQGRVTLTVTVDRSGKVSDVQIAKPLGVGLDEKAVAAVKTWTFEPAIEDGNPVPASLQVVVGFRLY